SLPPFFAARAGARIMLPARGIFKSERSAAQNRSADPFSMLMRSHATSLLCVQNGHYFHRPRIDDHDLIPGHEILIAAPRRFNFHNGPRKSSEPHRAWHTGTN